MSTALFSPIVVTSVNQSVSLKLSTQSIWQSYDVPHGRYPTLVEFVYALNQVISPTVIRPLFKRATLFRD